MMQKPACAILTAALLALASGCGRGEEKAEAPPPPMQIGPADAAVVRVDIIQTGPSLSGTLTAQRQASVRAQLSAPVIETFAEPGQRVSRGQILARLDDTALRDALTAARSAVTNARISLEVAQREEERQRVLVQAGAVAARNIDTSRQQTVAARSTLAQANSQLASAEERLGQTEIRAPFSGVVSERQVSAGDVVQPGGALYTVLDPSSLELEAAIPAERLATVEIGAPVSFTVNGYPDRVFEGRITRINPSVDPATRQVRVYAELPNTGFELPSGLFAEGRVASQSREGLVLPAEAIDRRMARPAVLRVEGGKVERIEVKLGLEDEQTQRVEILAGLRAGDVVLKGAAQEITPGTPVQLDPALRRTAERMASTL
jgi:RND family efflux transporter MFP subunit